MEYILSSPPSERAVLAALIEYGEEAYLDVCDMLQESTFTVDSNKYIWKCLQYIFSQENSNVDIASIQSAAHELNLSHILGKSEEIKHLHAIISLHVEHTNIRKFAQKIRKLEIGRLLCDRLDEAKNQLYDISGDESITGILGIAEDSIFNFSSLLKDGDSGPEKIGENIDEYLDYLENNVVEQVGLPTGFHAFDKANGGGLRDRTITVIGARTGIGKSQLAQNIGFYVANTTKIPVFVADTELTMDEIRPRNLAMVSGVPIENIETGKFGKNKEKRNKVYEAGKSLENAPYFHKSIAGMPFEDQLAIIRRWIVKDVGLEKDGKAKPCLLIYDYLKLMNSDEVTSNLAEYQALGFMMSTLHNFAVRYNIPILAFIQLNRDGINKESTDVASGSDRIIWLCSSFTLFKRKSEEEIAQDGANSGTHKLVPLKSRYGGWDERNYINCNMKGWCAQITEGLTKFELDEQNAKLQLEEKNEPEIPFD